MKKHSTASIVLGIIPISAIALVLYCLETYDRHVHSETSFLVCVYCIIAFIISTVVMLCAKKTNRHCVILWLISTALLAFVFYVGSKIPFCVMCDRVTAEDLGFLTYWIEPEGPAQ